MHAPAVASLLLALALAAGPAYAQPVEVAPAAAPADAAPAEAPPSREAAPAAAKGDPRSPLPPQDTAPPDAGDDAGAEAVVADAPAAEDAPTAGAAAAKATPTPRARRTRSAPERWVRGQVPDELERPGPFGLEWWQWIALPVLALASALVGRVAGGLTALSIHRIVRATPAVWDDQLVRRSNGPLYLAWGVGAAALLIDLLFLRAPTAALFAAGLRIGLLLALVRLALRAVDIAGEAGRQTAVARGNAGAVSVVPLLTRASKIGLVALGVVTVLSSLGYPVASLLAGLGIGGLALALAAQKTAENVFGSVSIGVDQPFRVGDAVKIEDFQGVVERIGLRSTSIRTADRTLITLPNGRLADMRVENFSVRDRMRFFCVLGLEYGATADQIRAVLAGVDAHLRAHPQVWPEGVSVHLVRLGASALEIEVMAWFSVKDPEMAALKESLLLALLDVVEGAGARLAFPTQTVNVVRKDA